LDFEYVPSLHFAVAPVGSVLPEAGFELDELAADEDFVVAGEVCEEAEPEGGVVAGGGVAAGAEAADELVEDEAPEFFWTPPWPLQAPRPVALEVVPSLHVVGAAAGAVSAAAGSAKASASNGAATSEASVVRFIGMTPWVAAMSCVRPLALDSQPPG
jgi:hypothetical protein